MANIGGVVNTVRLTTVGAVCAIGAVVCFLLGGVAMSSSGVQTLIPETGQPGRDWIADVDAAGNLFFAGTWFLILMGLLVIVAFVGFYDALRQAGPIMILAPILGAVGMTLVTVSHLIPIAMAYQLAPAYTHADSATQTALAATADTFASAALVINAAGDFLVWGIATPLYAVAIVYTHALPRWIGWLGLLVGLLGGWLGLLGPASDVVEGVSGLGFIGFFVFLAAMGVSMIRRRRPAQDPAT